MCGTAMPTAFASPCLWSGTTLRSVGQPRLSTSRSWRTAAKRAAAPPARFAPRCVAQRSDDGTRDSEFDISDLPISSDSDVAGVEKRNELFEFVKQVPPPELVAKFASAAPTVVQKAIRQTIVSMLGTLPIGAFAPSVKTVSANLVQLFHSSLISGYMFRNAAYRLELTRSLGSISELPALPGANKEPEIRGGVAVFQSDDGTEMAVPVDQYVEELRSQVNTLRDELVRERKGGNEYVSHVQSISLAYHFCCTYRTTQCLQH
jgi:Protein of unknown function (DUF760)